jgi:hypothetical protein
LYSASKTYLEILVSKKIYEELKNDYVIEKFGDNFVISIKKTADEESMCITVNAKDNLYLTTNYIVTHNSLTMANLATNCLKQNKKVQVATFELSEKNWAKRVSSIITGIELSNLHYKSDELRKEIETLKSSLEKGRLNIKQFPANEITPRQYSSFLKQLKRVDGFVPDIIILDMHSLMIPNSGNQSKGYNMYKDQKDLAANVRSLSYIWECPILSPTQLDIKNSLKQEDPDMSATLESQGIPQTADAQINFWQDQNAKEGSWINYRVVKSRFSVKGQGGKLSIDYRNMKMTDFNSEMENMINSVSSSNFNFDFDTIQG